LLYKWPHSRIIIAKVLTEKYSDLMQTGWTLAEADVRRDVKKLFEDNFTEWISGAR
jgi:hypothetical protein